jgi:signal transduction histidine kinase
LKTFGRPRVLICDDEGTVRQICERALLQAGYDTTCVENGLDAIAAVKREAFDMIILDVRLPDMDGPEVLAVLREIDPDLPVLVISGFSAFEDAIRCLRQGATDFVRKPFDIETVVRAVDRVIGSTHLKVDSALLAASQSIFSSLDFAEIAQRVLRVALSLLRADEASITLCDRGELGEMYRIREAKTGDLVERPPLRATAPLRRLINVHEPVVLSRESSIDAELVLALSLGADTILARRLCVRDRPVGILAVGRGPDGRAFGERDVRRLMLLSGHVALALDNARLHAESSARARDLERAIDRLIVAERIASVGRLSAGLGHEIANPACSVLAYLEVARDAIAASQPGEARDAIERATKGANTILDVCQALRPLSSGKRRNAIVDLKTVIDGALLLAMSELRTRARVVVDLPPNPPILFGDPAKLGQVLLNLLLNAAQALPPNAADEHEVRVSVRSDGAWVVLRVEDTGKGVPPELVPNLFESGVTTKSSDGHGMGLAICKWIVEEAEGTIECLPAARGAAFEVRLPARPKTLDVATATSP